MIFDTRWEGSHGIGRVTAEIRARLFANRDYITPKWPRSPTSPIDPWVRGAQMMAYRRATYYSPGFNPPAFAQHRAVFTVHDLIHLRVSEERTRLKNYYYERIVRPAVHNCFRTLTVSEYSRQDLLDWTGAPPDNVVNVGNGVDESFFSFINPVRLGYPYLLYIGGRKPHKNLDRILEAYATSRASHEIHLVLSGNPEPALIRKTDQFGCSDRVHFAGHIPESALNAYYRGAVALLFPSYFEGFGLPPLEAMACGIPVLTSNLTSIPEVVGDAALMVDPFSTEALRDGIDRITFDTDLRLRLSISGPRQARKHTWDKVASRVANVLDELKETVKA